ncbi:hypothetical protein QL285_068322 [Trifolium repens]|nr:hypothetical protein QL285_068322 [Trifolium repens]
MNHVAIATDRQHEAAKQCQKANYYTPPTALPPTPSVDDATTTPHPYLPTISPTSPQPCTSRGGKGQTIAEIARPRNSHQPRVRPKQRFRPAANPPHNTLPKPPSLRRLTHPIPNPSNFPPPR